MSPQKKRQKTKNEIKERLATIFRATVACFPASQPGSQPVHHEATHPASKQANRFISFSGATGTAPSNATKQRATVLHHFPSERPTRPQPLITRRCQSEAHQGLRHRSLFTTFFYGQHTTRLTLCPRESLSPALKGVNKNGEFRTTPKNNNFYARCQKTQNVVVFCLFLFLSLDSGFTMTDLTTNNKV